MSSILIIEDNELIALGLKNNLEIEGHTVDLASDGLEGVERAKARYDLIILDLMLPGLDGYRVLQQIRSAGNDVPVLMLTARGDEADKVRGFRLGADDYVTKPFGVLELLARVEALLRRIKPARAEAPAKFHEFGSLKVDEESRSVTRDGRQIPLTPKEFDLLVALIHRNGACVSRNELLTEVWGYRTTVPSRTVDTHVGELRRKLEKDPAAPQHIVTVRKAGYRLQA
jgi:two-component system, OmpR family, alkaline phosphatase synthesis response regulator PhoP